MLRDARLEAVASQLLLDRGQRLVVLAAYVIEDLCELLVLRCRSPHDPASIAKVRLLTLLAHLIPPIAMKKKNSYLDRRSFILGSSLAFSGISKVFSKNTANKFI